MGPTYDYTQRLLNFALLADGGAVTESLEPSADTASALTVPIAAIAATENTSHKPMPRINELIAKEGLLETPRPVSVAAPGDLTRQPLMFPADRPLRLQALARGDEGWLLSLGYAGQRGYANAHPFAGEIRRGKVSVEILPDELGFTIDIGDVEVTECQMVTQFAGNREVPPQFTQGYGLAFGGAERKSMAMALVDRALRARELGEEIVAPGPDEEFVLPHADSLEASGFVQHLKLPHYVDFQSELELVRKLRAAHAAERDIEANTARHEANSNPSVQAHAEPPTQVNALHKVA